MSRGRPVPKIPRATQNLTQRGGHEILPVGRPGQNLTQRRDLKFFPWAGLCRRFLGRTKFNTAVAGLSRGRTEVAQRSPRGRTEVAQRSRRGPAEVAQRSRRGRAGVAQRSRRGRVEVAQRSPRGRTEEPSRRNHPGTIQGGRPLGKPEEPSRRLTQSLIGGSLRMPAGISKTYRRELQSPVRGSLDGAVWVS